MGSSGGSPESGIPAVTGTSVPARLDRLEREFAELSSRLAAIERSAPPARPAAAAGRAGGPAGVAPAEDQTLTFGGRVRSGKATMVAGYSHSVDDVLAADPDRAARLFAALASPARIALLQALLDGPRSSQQLRGVLDDPSVGQLYHHLKELLAAGLVIQPGRSVYALRRGSPVELCILILAAAKLAPAGPHPEPDTP